MSDSNAPTDGSGKRFRIEDGKLIPEDDAADFDAEEMNFDE